MGGIISMLISARFSQGLGFVPSENSIPRTCEATEAAVSIDLILEKIFSLLDIASLKSCRLVSSRWKELGAAELQKRLIIKLNLFFRTKEDRVNSTEQVIHFCDVHPCYTLDYFSDEREQGPDARNLCCRRNLSDQLLSLIETSNNFPCNSFVICSQTISSVQMQNLIFALRPVMKTLKLCINMYVGPPRDDQDDSWVYDDLKKLFLQGQDMKDFEIVRPYSKHDKPHCWMTLYINAIFNETRRGCKGSDHISICFIQYY